MAYDGIVSRYINRRLSRPAARALARTPVTPNSITIFTLLLAFATAGGLAAGYNIAGGIAIQIVSVVDGIDGELARLRNAATRFGAVLDAVTDRYADAAIIGGLTVYAVRFEDYPRPEVIGMLALAGALSVSYSRARIEASLYSTGAEATAGQPSAASLPPPASLDSVFGLGSRDVRSLIMAIGAVLGQAYITLCIVAVITGLTVVWRLVYLRFWTTAGRPRAQVKEEDAARNRQ